MNTNLKGEINFLAKPIGILFLIIGLFVFLLSFGIKQINTIRSKIAANKKVEATLNQKIQTLETVGEILAGDVTFLDVVLPSKGSVLYGLSQIKSQSITYGVALSSLKTGTSVPEEGGLNKISISFDVEGQEQSIYSFLTSFSKILPLMNVDKASFSKSGEVTRASVTLSVYSSELPKKIPAVTEAVKELSNEDITLLKELSTYLMPQFVEPGVSTTTSPKTDPFN